MSSVAGYTGHPGIEFYSAAKFGALISSFFSFPDLTQMLCCFVCIRIISALERISEALRREMPPEWNISIVILEPGGFLTNARTNAHVLPAHSPTTPLRPPAHFLISRAACRSSETRTRRLKRFTIWLGIRNCRYGCRWGVLHGRWWWIKRGRRWTRRKSGRVSVVRLMRMNLSQVLAKIRDCNLDHRLYTRRKWSATLYTSSL